MNRRRRWSLKVVLDTVWLWNVFLARDRKGDKGGAAVVIDMFVQRAEQCRDTTVESWVKRSPWGPPAPGHDKWADGNGDTADEQGLHRERREGQKWQQYLLWTNCGPFRHRRVLSLYSDRNIQRNILSVDSPSTRFVLHLLMTNKEALYNVHLLLVELSIYPKQHMPWEM